MRVSSPLRLAPLALLAWSCTPPRQLQSSSGSCVFNADCASPLVCAARTCRAPCRTDRDCTNSFLCRPSGRAETPRVCLPPTIPGYCAASTDCDPGYSCRLGVCAQQCPAMPCAAGFTCDTARGVCAPLPAPDASADQSSPDAPAPDAAPEASLDAGPEASPDAAPDALPEASPDALDAAPDGPAPDAAPEAAVDAAGAEGGDAGGCALRPSPDVWLTRVRNVSLDGTTGYCALGSDASLWCWSDGASPRRLLPLDGVPGTEVRYFDTQFSAPSCVLVANGDVYCWGDNARGQFGMADPASSATPVRSTGFSGRGLVSVHTANYLTCGHTADGRVLCAGEDSLLGFGRGSAGTPSPHPTPEEAWLSLPALDVSVGLGAVFVRVDAQDPADPTASQLWLWGSEFQGCFGINPPMGLGGSSADVLTPTPYLLTTTVPVGSFARVVGADFAAGGCALTRDNALYCWGDNQSNWLGSFATRVNLGQAVRIGSAAVRDFAVTSRRVSYVTASRQLWYQGIAFAGGIRSTPAPEPLFTGAVVTSVSGDGRCVTLADGTVTCAVLPAGASAYVTTPVRFCP